MVGRLKAHDAGEAAPKPGEMMPPFAMPDDNGAAGELDDCLRRSAGDDLPPRPLVSYCRINTRALPKPRRRSPRRARPSRRSCRSGKQFAAAFKADSEMRYPVLTDIDNGYALSLNLAIWVGEEMQQILAAGGRDVA